ncbi:hypothetical protein Poli38472_009929 [Pythium oligandrum]|uniref:Protein kinase domain-containing protein n=1 Tax=Pythium oligandrum TaxID=41045 RepID=A0A8K1C8S0_PYTOL|nr:hypothetical protein Poli38472_009929 [Pythium oligandrum]|eukprot:TMW58370.1 hypothetical protein Poli38472_009929 [Pythium oligandrum]
MTDATCTPGGDVTLTLVDGEAVVLDKDCVQTPLVVQNLADTNRTLTARNLSIEVVTRIPDVDTLDLSFNNVVSVSDLSKDAPSLKKLVLSSNKLSSLDGISLPATLEDLDLSYNPLGTIPVLKDSLRLTKLTLSRAYLSSVENVSLPSSLKSLILTKNLIKSFNDVSLPSAISSVDLSFNLLSTFKGFDLPSSVTSLFLGGNLFTSLKGMNITSEISILYLHDLALSTLDDVSFPDTVTALSLQNCSLSNITDLRLPSELVFLDISENRLSFLPSVLPNSLQGITATDNQFTKIINIQFPLAIRRLQFGGNKITEVKGVLFPWALEVLNFGDTVITDFELRQSDFVMFQQSKTLNATIQQTSCSNTAAQKASYDQSTLCVLSDDLFASLYGNRDGDTITSSDSTGRSTSWIIPVVISVVAVLAIAMFFLNRNGTLRRWYYLLASNGNTANSTSTVDHDGPDPSLNKYRIPYNELAIEKAFAKGGSGIVYLASYQCQEVVVKKILPEKATDDKVLRGFLDEVLLFSTLDHAKITKFFGVSWNTLSDIAMVMEYLPNGDLSSLLKRQRDRPEVFHWFSSLLLPSKSQLALDVLEAVGYLHSFTPPIIHRDLKAKNVLLSESYEAKLGDFGVSTEWRPDTMTAGVGTMAWIAPEVLQGERYTEKADMYSFGVFLTELDTCSKPFDGVLNAVIVLKVTNGEERPAFGPGCPETIQDLGIRCLSSNPEDRPSAMMAHHHLKKLLIRSV